MKIIHTSDWHIGQSFFGYDRRKEHLCFFEWLRGQLKVQEADVLLIAGDIFDNPNPSAESQKIYYRFLKEITTENPELQVIIIAGNHDSAARLEAPDPLLSEMNVKIKGVIKKTPEGVLDLKDLLIPLKKQDEVVAWCMAVPYLRQGDYPPAESYAQGVGLMYQELYHELESLRQPGQGVIAAGHLQATGSEISENDRSERTVIGGLECISPDNFLQKNILYTALGHLHKAQRVSGNENIRYAGSPLPMSFAEKNYKQGVNLIEINGEQLIRIERINFTPPVSLFSIPKKPALIEEVLKEIALLPDGEADDESPFLEVKILIAEPEPSIRFQVEEALKSKAVRLTRLISITPAQDNTREIRTYEELKQADPMEIAEDVFRNRYNNEIPEHLKELLLEAIKEAGE